MKVNFRFSLRLCFFLSPSSHPSPLPPCFGYVQQKHKLLKQSRTKEQDNSPSERWHHEVLFICHRNGKLGGLPLFGGGRASFWPEQSRFPQFSYLLAKWREEEHWVWKQRTNNVKNYYLCILAIIRYGLFFEREKGNQSNWSDILLGREPLGEGLTQGHLVRRISSPGDDGTFCTPRSVWLPTADPLPISAPWPFHLPPCLQENVSSSWEVWASACGLPPAPPGLLLSASIAAVVLLLGFSSLSSWRRAISKCRNGIWTESHGLSSDKATWRHAHGRKNDTSQYISLSPWPLFTNINSRWMIKSPVSLLLFFYSALQALCFMFPIAPPEINQSNTCSRSLGRWRRPSTLSAVPRTNSCAVVVKRYVSAGLSYSEGKTIIVGFFGLFVCFFLSFFLPFLFLPTPQLVFCFSGFTLPY